MKTYVLCILILSITHEISGEIGRNTVIVNIQAHINDEVVIPLNEIYDLTQAVNPKYQVYTSESLSFTDIRESLFDKETKFIGDAKQSIWDENTKSLIIQDGGNGNLKHYSVDFFFKEVQSIKDFNLDDFSLKKMLNPSIVDGALLVGADNSGNFQAKIYSYEQQSITQTLSSEFKSTLQNPETLFKKTTANEIYAILNFEKDLDGSKKREKFVLELIRLKLSKTEQKIQLAQSFTFDAPKGYYFSHIFHLPDRRSEMFILYFPISQDDMPMMTQEIRFVDNQEKPIILDSTQDFTEMKKGFVTHTRPGGKSKLLIFPQDEATQLTQGQPDNFYLQCFNYQTSITCVKKPLKNAIPMNIQSMVVDDEINFAFVIFKNNQQQLKSQLIPLNSLTYDIGVVDLGLTDLIVDLGYPNKLQKFALINKDKLQIVQAQTRSVKVDLKKYDPEGDNIYAVDDDEPMISIVSNFKVNVVKCWHCTPQKIQSSKTKDRDIYDMESGILDFSSTLLIQGNSNRDQKIVFKSKKPTNFEADILNTGPTKFPDAQLTQKTKFYKGAIFSETEEKGSRHGLVKINSNCTLNSDVAFEEISCFRKGSIGMPRGGKLGAIGYVDLTIRGFHILGHIFETRGPKETKVTFYGYYGDKDLYTNRAWVVETKPGYGDDVLTGVGLFSGIQGGYIICSNLARKCTIYALTPVFGPQFTIKDIILEEFITFSYDKIGISPNHELADLIITTDNYFIGTLMMNGKDTPIVPKKIVKFESSGNLPELQFNLPFTNLDYDYCFSNHLIVAPKSPKLKGKLYFLNKFKTTPNFGPSVRWQDIHIEDLGITQISKMICLDNNQVGIYGPNSEQNMMLIIIATDTNWTKGFPYSQAIVDITNYLLFRQVVPTGLKTITSLSIGSTGQRKVTQDHPGYVFVFEDQNKIKLQFGIKQSSTYLKFKIGPKQQQISELLSVAISTNYITDDYQWILNFITQPKQNIEIKRLPRSEIDITQHSYTISELFKVTPQPLSVYLSYIGPKMLQIQNLPQFPQINGNFNLKRKIEGMRKTAQHYHTTLQFEGSENNYYNVKPKYYEFTDTLPLWEWDKTQIYYNVRFQGIYFDFTTKSTVVTWQGRQNWREHSKMMIGVFKDGKMTVVEEPTFRYTNFQDLLFYRPDGDLMNTYAFGMSGSSQLMVYKGGATYDKFLLLKYVQINYEEGSYFRIPTMFGKVSYAHHSLTIGYYDFSTDKWVLKPKIAVSFKNKVKSIKCKEQKPLGTEAKEHYLICFLFSKVGINRLLTINPTTNTVINVKEIYMSKRQFYKQRSRNTVLFDFNSEWLALSYEHPKLVYPMSWGGAHWKGIAVWDLRGDSVLPSAVKFFKYKFDNLLFKKARKGEKTWIFTINNDQWGDTKGGIAFELRQPAENSQFTLEIPDQSFFEERIDQTEFVFIFENGETRRIKGTTVFNANRINFVVLLSVIVAFFVAMVAFKKIWQCLLISHQKKRSEKLEQDVERMLLKQKLNPEATIISEEEYSTEEEEDELPINL